MAEVTLETMIEAINHAFPTCNGVTIKLVGSTFQAGWGGTQRFYSGRPTVLEAVRSMYTELLDEASKRVSEANKHHTTLLAMLPKCEEPK